MNVKTATIFHELRAYFWDDKGTFFCVAATVALNGFLWWYLSAHIPNAEEFRVLRYSVYFGITDFGPARQLYSIPFIGTILGGVNIILGLFLHSRERSFARILLGCTVLVQVLILIALIAILSQKVPQ